MSDAQRSKAERLRDEYGFPPVDFVRGYIDDVPHPDGSVDVVISNGVINLSADKLLSDNARAACTKFGVRSISLLAP